MAIPFIIGAVAVVYGGGKTLQALDNMNDAERIRGCW